MTDPKYDQGDRVRIRRGDAYNRVGVVLEPDPILAGQIRVQLYKLVPDELHLVHPDYADQYLELVMPDEPLS